MAITASQVKELRERTSAGMMDCKTALNETGGDFEAAVDWLRKKGIAKAAKKASRIAAEGVVAAVAEGNKGAIVEVNSETDFVAKNAEFISFVDALARLVMSTGTTDIEALKATDMNGKSVEDTLTDLVAKIGENMSIRRAEYVEVNEGGSVVPYIHMGGKIGVLVGLDKDGEAKDLESVAKSLAMHIAAANPLFKDRDSVDPAAVEREKAVFADQARQSGKPEEIIEKMIVGRINKYFQEVCLLDQDFIMDTDKKINQVLKEANAMLTSYARFGLGEGIEKKEDNFAEEVAAAASA